MQNPINRLPYSENFKSPLLSQRAFKNGAQDWIAIGDFSSLKTKLPKPPKLKRILSDINKIFKLYKPESLLKLVVGFYLFWSVFEKNNTFFTLFCRDPFEDKPLIFASLTYIHNRCSSGTLRKRKAIRPSTELASTRHDPSFWIPML